jgi:RecB family exonuclease
MSAAIARGEFDEVETSEVADALSRKWDENIAIAQAKLAKAWALAVVPTPTRWPRYELMRLRLSRFLINEVSIRRQRTSAGGLAHSHVAIEQWLEGPEGKIGGRPDRVEQTAAGVEIIDIKSGGLAKAQGTDTIPPGYRRQLLLYAYLWQAVHGVWPARASVQDLDGHRLTFDIDKAEASQLAKVAIAKLESYNSGVEAGVLAEPSPEHCSYCPYRGSCTPFLESLAPDWEWYRKTMAGTVIAVSLVKTKRAVLEVDLHYGNLAEGVARARVIDIPAELIPALGTDISVVDALPAGGAQDAWVAWDTQLWIWQSARGRGGPR